MAFPSKDCEKNPLKPYDLKDFPEQEPADNVMAGTGKGDVHDERSDESGFLFRIDYGVKTEYCRRPVILVQSAKPPDWDYAFGLTGARNPQTGKPIGNAGCLLAAPPERKKIEYDVIPDGLRVHIWCLAGDAGPTESTAPDSEYLIQKGAEFRFRLNANPTRKIANGPFDGKRVRVGRDPAAILGWLAGKGSKGGFEIVFEKDDKGWDNRWRITTAMFYAWKEKGSGDQAENKMAFACAMIDGILKVTDPVTFSETVTKGIGRAKAFGFGLLSLAPVCETKGGH